MKKYLFSLCIIAFALCLVGCENKAQTLNEEPSSTTSTTTTSTTTSTDTTGKEKDTTTTSKRTTTTTKKRTTTTSTTSSKEIIITTRRHISYSDDSGNKQSGYMICYEENKSNCKCFSSGDILIECPK